MFKDELISEYGSHRARYTENSYLLDHVDFQISATSDPVRILACRAMANAASHQWGRALFTHDVNTTVTVVAAQLTSPKPALQVCIREVFRSFFSSIEKVFAIFMKFPALICCIFSWLKFRTPSGLCM